jgi:uncharacterized repeat protein (TIGR03803 family)
MKKIIFFVVVLGFTFFVSAQNKVLYGVTSMGGSGNYGVLFGYDINEATYTVKKNFDAGNLAEGISPRGSLTKISNGKLYGMTYLGGTNNSGTLFEYDPVTENYAVKVNFSNSYGQRPVGSVIQATNGKLYGMTSKGGGSNSGTLFEYDPANETYEVKVTFNGTNGNEPQGSLIQASNGKLYGMTYLSSINNNNKGVLFEYDPATSAYSVKIQFNNDNGSRPYGDLVEKDGKLYGMTREGGINDAGILFEYDTSTVVLTKKLDFGGANGSNPVGTLCMASNGKFYGLSSGGTGGSGLIFEYDPATNMYVKKIDFNFDNGSNPQGSLIQSSDGKLYGLSSYGGSSELGTMFSFDISTGTINNILTFDGANGSTPYYTKLLEVNQSSLTTAETSKADIKLYPNPVDDLLYLKGVSKATAAVFNAAGQQVLKTTITNGQLNMDSLTKGVYILNLEYDGKISSHKIVKE